MADRDEKGKFAKGNKAGRQFQPSSSDGQATAADMGRKGGSVTKINRIQKWFDTVNALGAHELTAEETYSIDKYLLSMTRDELIATSNDSNTPMIIRSRAHYLADQKTTFVGTEVLLDRAFGKPKQKSENDTTVKAEVKTEDSDFDLLDEETQMEIVRKIQDAKHALYMKEHSGENKSTDKQ